MPKVRGLTPARDGFFPSFLVVLFFLKSYFLFLTDSKYAGRLIAASLSAFISKTISPQASHIGTL